MFPTDSHQRHGIAPRRVTRFSEPHIDAGVAIGVPFDRPFESEVEQRRVFDMKFAGTCGIFGRCGAKVRRPDQGDQGDRCEQREGPRVSVSVL
jgi:hypothetical protein